MPVNQERFDDDFVSHDLGCADGGSPGTVAPSSAEPGVTDPSTELLLALKAYGYPVDPASSDPAAELARAERHATKSTQGAFDRGGGGGFQRQQVLGNEYEYVWTPTDDSQHLSISIPGRCFYCDVDQRIRWFKVSRLGEVVRTPPTLEVLQEKKHPNSIMAKNTKNMPNLNDFRPLSFFKPIDAEPLNLSVPREERGSGREKDAEMAMCGRCLTDRKRRYGRPFDALEAANRIYVAGEELAVVASDYVLKPDSVKKYLKKQHAAIDLLDDFRWAYAETIRGWKLSRIRKCDIDNGHKPPSHSQMRRRLNTFEERFGPLNAATIERIRSQLWDEQAELDAAA